MRELRGSFLLPLSPAVTSWPLSAGSEVSSPEEQLVCRDSAATGLGVKGTRRNTALQKMALWHEDYVELKATKEQQR